MVTTGTPGLHVAGLAVTSASTPAAVPVRAAYAALHDARFPVSAVATVIHVGPGPVGPVSAAVRDGIGAGRCRRAFDVDGGPAAVIAALAVGASLLDDTGAVLITVVEQDGATASIVLTGGSSAAATMDIDRARTDRSPYVLRSTSPVRGLLDARASGHRDVVLVSDGENTPAASVRCLFD